MVPTRDAVLENTDRVATLLREAPSGDLPVSGLDWTVGQLGAHLVSVARRYRTMLEDGMAFPERMSALNREHIDAVSEDDPGRLADLLAADVAALLALVGDDEARSVPFFGMQHTVAGLSGVLLGELLLHGLDLARTLGRPWPIRADQALLATDGVIPILPNFVDRAVAERAPGTYHVRLRPDRDWTIEVDHGEVTVSPGRPARADLHVSAEPVTYLLLGYGRTPRWRAVLSGRLRAWGRRPWLARRFGALFAET